MRRHSAFRWPSLLDFFTLGMAEAQRFEHELKRGTPRAGILVLYDEDQLVESTCVYQGQGAVGSRKGAPPICPDWMLRLSECLEEREGEP